MDKVIVTKEMTSTVIRQFQYDTGTTTVRLIIPENVIDADPRALTWTIRYVNADDTGDLAIPEVQFTEDAVLLCWTIGGLATAAVGTTSYCVHAVGVSPDGDELVWQSANGTILVAPTLDVMPSEEQQSALSALDDLILLVREQLSTSGEAIQSISQTADTALQTAQSASAAAQTALSSANSAASNAQTALTTAGSAASNAQTALSAANSAASDAQTALSSVSTAASNAQTALSSVSTAVSNAQTALTTANSAASNAQTALSTANSAASNAQTALSTAGTAAAAVSTLSEALQMKADRFPHAYALDGANLKEVFGSADALYAALEQEDYSKIHNLDYYPIRFQGTYRDYGEWVAPAGTTYYDYDGEAVGTLDSDTVVESSYESPSFYYVIVSDEAYHVKMQDCQRWHEKTINVVAKMEANINAYWGYGDDGSIMGKTPHITWVARDGIGWFSYRSNSMQWADSVEQTATGDGSTAVFSSSDFDYNCVRYVCVNNELKTYNEDYTVDFSNGEVEFNSEAIPQEGDEILISRTTHNIPWVGSALYKTMNDPEYGLLRLIDDSEFASHIYEGPNENGMRYLGEIWPIEQEWIGSDWGDRGKMFIPIESEIWGTSISAYIGNADLFLPKLPVFADGGMRRVRKASHDEDFFDCWWIASENWYGITCVISDTGISDIRESESGWCALVPCFVGL